MKHEKKQVQLAVRRRTLQILAVAGLAALTATSADGAGRSSAAPPQLFEPGGAARGPRDRALVPDAVEELPVELDPATVAANPPLLTLDLPGLPPLEAVRTRFVEYRPDWKSWSGTLRYPGAAGRGTGYIHLGYHGDQVTALIDFEGERFRIAGGHGESHRLLRLSDDLSPRSCAMNPPAESLDALSGAEGAGAVDPSSSLGVEPGSQGLLSTSQAIMLGGARIDVLAVYPKAYFTAANAADESTLPVFVQDSISLANDAFSNSGINAYYNLVGVVPLTGSLQPQSGLSSSLRWLDGRAFNSLTAPPPQEVSDLRNAFGADLVTLYIPFEWKADDYCGLANLPLANNPTTGASRFFRGDTILQTAMGDRAFSVSRQKCGLQDYTLGHEMAHNYGMHHHDVSATDSRWLYPYGRGKLLNLAGGSTRATVMACHCTGCACDRSCALGTGAVCNRIPYFSDPTRTYNGVTLGNSDPADPRDNARVGRGSVATYAGFRPPSTNTPPNASMTVSCTGRACTFNAGGSTDNAAIPSSGYWWDFGDGQTGTGRTPSHTYSAAGNYRVHLVVKDAGGQTDVYWGWVEPTILYEGNHDGSSCAGISGWAWDTTPNDPVRVDIYRDGSKVATVTAGAFRADLLSAGKGNGYHGFSYLPDSGWQDGVWHSSLVRYAGTSINLSSTPKSLICNARIFTTQTPFEDLTTGGQVYTVATQFSSSRSGSITKLGFHRSGLETGTNTLRLWTDGGVQLASVTTSCSGGGWCWGSIPPVAITAGTRYRVSVNTNSYQSKTGCGIGSGITNDPLTAHSGYWVAGNVFPTNGSCSNFFVDVSFNL